MKLNCHIKRLLYVFLPFSSNLFRNPTTVSLRFCSHSMRSVRFSASAALKCSSSSRSFGLFTFNLYELDDSQKFFASFQVTTTFVSSYLWTSGLALHGVSSFLSGDTILDNQHLFHHFGLFYSSLALTNKSSYSFCHYIVT